MCKIMTYVDFDILHYVRLVVSSRQLFTSRLAASWTYVDVISEHWVLGFAGTVQGGMEL